MKNLILFQSVEVVEESLRWAVRGSARAAVIEEKQLGGTCVNQRMCA